MSHELIDASYILLMTDDVN